MGRPRTPPTARAYEADRMRREGKRYRDICAHFGVCMGTVCGWLQKVRNQRAADRWRHVNGGSQ